MISFDSWCIMLALCVMALVLFAGVRRPGWKDLLALRLVLCSYLVLLIQGAVSYGNELLKINDDLNHFIHHKYFSQGLNIAENIKKAAKCLSDELLYIKFLQGIPFVGAVGGGYDALYMNRINSYASMKYNYRYLNGRLRR